MQKAIVILSIIFFISGCGKKDDSINTTTAFNGSSDESQVNTDPGTTLFDIGPTRWQIKLPPGWQPMPNGDNPSHVFAAQNHTQNFLVNQYPGFKESLIEEITQNMKASFYFFEGISKSPLSITFRAQTSPSKAIRIYHQELRPIPGATSFMLGSCSHETHMPSDECLQILEDWKTLTTE